MKYIAPHHSKLKLKVEQFTKFTKKNLTIARPMGKHDCTCKSSRGTIRRNNPL